MPSANPLISAVDIVGVYDQDTYAQVFAGARPMKAMVERRSRLMEQPLENGALVPDHRIILPTEIVLPVLVSQQGYNAAYSEIAALFNAATLLLVQTKADSFFNMVIADLPHEETPELYDTLTVYVRFRERLFAEALTEYSAADAQDADTVASGSQQPTTKSYGSSVYDNTSKYLL